MPMGSHRFNFNCDLPLNSPESFKTKLGSVDYFVEAKLDDPSKFEEKFMLQFKVVRQTEFNYCPELLLSMCSEEIENFCCCCCKSEPFIVSVTLPCSGYVSGQKIPFAIEYVNKSDVDIEATDVILTRTIIYQW